MTCSSVCFRAAGTGEKGESRGVSHIVVKCFKPGKWEVPVTQGLIFLWVLVVQYYSLVPFFIFFHSFGLVALRNTSWTLSQADEGAFKMHILGLHAGLWWSTDTESLEMFYNQLCELSANQMSYSSPQFGVGVSHTNVFLPSFSLTLVALLFM